MIESASDNVVDGVTKRPIVGALIYVFDQAGQEAALYAPDLTTRINGPLVTDDFGLYTIRAATGFYRAEVHVNGRLRYVIGNVQVGEAIYDPSQFAAAVRAGKDIGLFTAAAGIPIADDINLVQTSGHTVMGRGIARYGARPDLTQAFLDAYPKVAFRSGNGRIFALNEPEITPEMLGAAATYDPAVNDRPFVQGAQDAAEALGIGRVRFLRDRYAIWTPPRTSDIKQIYDESGHGLVIRKTIAWEGCASRTRLLFFTSTGGSRATQYQVMTGWTDGYGTGPRIWRGGGVFVLGDHAGAANPDPRSIERLSIRNIILDGQCPFDVDRAVPASWATPGDAATGRGWDLSDKGLWLQDTVAGDFEFTDFEMVGFRGEIYHMAGGAPRSQSLTRCKFHKTSGDALNSGSLGYSTIIDCEFGDAYQACEGLGGGGQKFIGCRFYNANAAFFTGGPSDYTGIYNYAYPKRRTDINAKYMTFSDCTFESIGLITLGSWIRGSIYTVDCSIVLPGFPGATQDVDLTVSAWKDLTDGGTAFSINGVDTATQPVPGAPAGVYKLPVSNVTVRVTANSTALAKANNRKWTRAFGWGGLIDYKTVAVIVEQAEAAVCPGATFASPEKGMPGVQVRSIRYAGAIPSFLPGEQLTAPAEGLTINPSSTDFVVSVSGAAGARAVSIDTTGNYRVGQIIRIWRPADNTVGNVLTFAKASGGMKLRDDRVLRATNDWIDLRWNSIRRVWEEEAVWSTAA